MRMILRFNLLYTYCKELCTCVYNFVVSKTVYCYLVFLFQELKTKNTIHVRTRLRYSAE